MRLSDAIGLEIARREEVPERVRRCTTHHHACDCREWEFAQIKVRIEALKKAAEKLLTHRDVPCSAVHDVKEDCGLVSHNLLVCRTKEARDDLAALAALLQEPVAARQHGGVE